MFLEPATVLIAFAIDSILNKKLLSLSEPKEQKKRESDTGVSLSLSLPMVPASSHASQPKEHKAEPKAKKPARARQKPTEDKPQRSSAPRTSAKKKTPIDQELVNAVVEHIKTELPELIETLHHTQQPAYVSEALDFQYLKQISLAQEFLNENRSADLSRVKCLLRKMFPREYHDIIESLKEHQDPTIIYNINGGNNIIAPKAKTAKQLHENQDRTVNDGR